VCLCHFLHEGIQKRFRPIAAEERLIDLPPFRFKNGSCRVFGPRVENQSFEGHADHGGSNVRHVASGNSRLSEDAELLVDVPGILRNEHDVDASFPRLSQEREHVSIVLLSLGPIARVVEHLRLVEDRENRMIERSPFHDVDPILNSFRFREKAQLIGAEIDAEFLQNEHPRLVLVHVYIRVDVAAIGEPLHRFPYSEDCLTRSDWTLNDSDHEKGFPRGTSSLTI
jgi:hypothetical protein